MNSRKLRHRTIAASILLVTGVAVTGAFAQTGQARFSGRITNSDGGPVPSAVIVVCNEDANLWFMTSTDAAGAFDLTELPANEFWVEVLAPLWRRPNGIGVWGYAPWTGSVELGSRQNLQRNISLVRLDILTPKMQTVRTPFPCSPSRPYTSVGPDRLANLLIEQAPVVYPQRATGAKTDDQITLEAFMNKDGKVISLRLLAPSWPPKVDPALTRAAVESVHNWRYRLPQLVSGRNEVFEFGGQIVVDLSGDQ